MRDVLDLVALLELVPFDPERSPWDVTMIGGPEAGRAALYLRCHHVLTDGVGGVRLRCRGGNPFQDALDIGHVLPAIVAILLETAGDHPIERTNGRHVWINTKGYGIRSGSEWFKAFDLGAGRTATAVASSGGKVYAVDIDRGFFAHIESRATEAGVGNVQTVLGEFTDPRLPARDVDVAFFHDVLHHIENRPAYYLKPKKALKPGGRIVNIDFYKKPLPVGPPVSMKLSEEEVQAEFQKAGFELAKSFDFLPYQYFLVFE